MGFENYHDLRKGDIIECFRVEEVKTLALMLHGEGAGTWPFSCQRSGCSMSIGAALGLAAGAFRMAVLTSAIETLAHRTGSRDRNRSYFMAAGRCALRCRRSGAVAEKRLAVWLLGGGPHASGRLLRFLWLRHQPEARADDDRWRKAWNAAMVSTAAFAFSAYAMRSGILT